MSREQREALRSAISEAVRAGIDWQAVERCQGCGCELGPDDFGRPMYVDGCLTCTDRRYKRSERERLTVQLTFDQLAA